MLSNLEEVLGTIPNTSTSLYVLCDFKILQKENKSLHDFVELYKQKNVKLLRYEDNNSSLEKQIENLSFLKENLNISIISNKIQLIEFCDGVHLNQEDFNLIHKDKKIALKLLRKKIQNKLISLAIEDEIQILEANDLDLDLISLDNYKNIRYLRKISRHPVFITEIESSIYEN